MTATFLSGSNLSGRSDWLADRRRRQPWPKTAYIGPYPELACTGLATTVREELQIAKGDGKSKLDPTIPLSLGTLADSNIYALSGGEMVRLALASTMAQSVKELQVDTALEQLDVYWRSRLFALLASPNSGIAGKCFIADNHELPTDSALFDQSIAFSGKDGRDQNFLRSIEISKLGDLSPLQEAQPIILKNVSFFYHHSRPVLRDVSFTLDPGRLYFLSGPNGSGKSTLVKLLSGTLLPRQGIIQYGKQVFRPGRSTDRFASCAFQNPDFQWTELSASAQLQNGWSADDATTDAASMLERFGIPRTEVATNPIELPFVFKKRLSLASALVARKPWLILDEPTLGQDKVFSASLAQCFRRLLNLGIGIILISHDTRFKSLFADANELRFEAGRIIALCS